MKKKKKIVVTLLASNYTWLLALARANSHNGLNRAVKPKDLLTLAALALVCAARQSEGYQADSARLLLQQSGYHTRLSLHEKERLLKREKKAGAA